MILRNQINYLIASLGKHAVFCIFVSEDNQNQGNETSEICGRMQFIYLFNRFLHVYNVKIRLGKEKYI